MLKTYAVYKFIRLLTTPFNEWDAYEHGIIDENGNILRKRKTLKSMKEKRSFTSFDLLVLNLKKMLEKAPGGKQKITSYAAALYLIRESTNLSALTDSQIENLAEGIINEDVPTNSASSGSIAGIGQGEDGEPGVSKKAQRRYTKANKRRKEIHVDD